MDHLKCGLKQYLQIRFHCRCFPSFCFSFSSHPLSSSCLSRGWHRRGSWGHAGKTRSPSPYEQQPKPESAERRSCSISFHTRMSVCVRAPRPGEALSSPWRGRWWQPRWTWGSRGGPNTGIGWRWRGGCVSVGRAAGRSGLAGAWLASGAAAGGPWTEADKEKRQAAATFAGDAVDSYFISSSL